MSDGSALRAVHAADASYLPARPDGAEFYDPSQHGPDLSRGFPGLRVWLSVKLLGAARFRAAIAEKRQLAVEASARIARIAGVTVVAPPELSLFAFHLTHVTGGLDAENRATRELVDRIRDRGKVMLTGCTVAGRFLARVCILSFRTRQAQVDTLVEQIEEETASILSGRPAS